ncbi:acyl-CoA-binding protein [Dokdonia sp. Hel_I_53]|uniref:acyl-CoA-binding protein n=1 Tax=Dokdonia sp. Hel_I_53 TaxID=1566287 RepID=UPI0011996FB5|nr:acyl-CoA-binding protein [Dokdonia sp. Hel_I_53]TVZ52088.1 acyl-CoA-binding protein [Dokdonia sp. Hel_I_53]
MKKKVLHTKFEEAFKRVSEATQDFPPDVLLQFYALYKQATQENSFSNSEGEHELVSAFKLNALLQVKHLSIQEAKKTYIEIAEKYLIN